MQKIIFIVEKLKNTESAQLVSQNTCRASAVQWCHRLSHLLILHDSYVLGNDEERERERERD